MYGDSHALSSDSCSILQSHLKLTQEKQFLLMESDAETEFKSQNSSGILRFRSAPAANFTFGGEKGEILGSDEVNSMHVMSENEGSVNRFTAMDSQLPPQYPRGQFGYEQGQDGKFGSSPLRQNSSPAGFLSHLTSQNGYSGVRGIGSYGCSNGDLSPSSSRIDNRMNFSSGLPGMLSRINESVNENTGLDEGKVGNSSGDSLFFTSGFPFGSWNDSSYFAENFSTSGIKREMDSDPKLFGNTEKCELGNRPNILSQHLSLPKTSAEMTAMDKLLQLQDTIPCKVRAKRGCATHPRSIAERVRRTRISERMKKLQELVPNMDKQTNTSDMLDLAVDYIKSLQKQYEV
ncbi:hypothetical protein ACS0TY_025542 [Phlomoides rotata]